MFHIDIYIKEMSLVLVNAVKNSSFSEFRHTLHSINRDSVTNVLILYYRRVAPASAVGVIFLWNNPANPMGGMLG